MQILFRDFIERICDKMQDDTTFTYLSEELRLSLNHEQTLNMFYVKFHN